MACVYDVRCFVHCSSECECGLYIIVTYVHAIHPVQNCGGHTITPHARPPKFWREYTPAQNTAQGVIRGGRCTGCIGCFGCKFRKYHNAGIRVIINILSC